MRRAQTEEMKAERARSLVAAAVALCEATPFSDLKLSDVTQKVGLAKASLFFYFPNKESLGIAMVTELLTHWFADVNARLERSGPSESKTIARLLAQTTPHNKVLVELLSQLGTALEPGLDVDTALRFKTFLAEQMHHTGTLLERSLPFLGRGGGVRFLLHFQIVLVGVHHASVMAPTVARLLSTPELRHLRIDPLATLERELFLHLEGLAATARERS